MEGKVLVKCFNCGGKGVVPTKQKEIKLGTICLNCGGSGSLPMEAFAARVVSDEFELVACQAESHYVYPQGTITYAEFLNGRKPAIMPNSVREDYEKFNRGRVEQFLDKREQRESTLNLDRALP